jgi:hypothetical protein
MAYEEALLKAMTTENIERAVATQALAIQDACNLSGLVFSFASFMQLICELNYRPGGGSTEFKNRHPAVILYVSKLVSLCGCEDTAEFSKAYDWCIAKRGTAE